MIVLGLGPLGAGLGCASSSAGGKLPTYYCTYVEKRLLVDGRLDEPEWKRAEPLQLVVTDTGQEPALPTVARMLWNDLFLYIGFECQDRSIQAAMRHADDDLWREEEVVEVFIGPRPEGVEYFEFEVNPQNARLDLNCVTSSPKGDGLRVDKEWNCIGWYSGVKLDGTLNKADDEDRGWSCEIAIPLESLTSKRPAVQHGRTWRVNLYRINGLAGGAEYSAWSPTGAINYHIPGRFGYCQFIKGSPPEGAAPPPRR